MNASYSEMYRALMAGELQGDEELDAAKTLSKQLVRELKGKGYVDDLPNDIDDDDTDRVITQFVNTVSGTPEVDPSTSSRDQRTTESSEPEILVTVRTPGHTYAMRLSRLLARLFRR